MARGDMLVENATLGSGAEILNRPPFEAVSMTIDFSATGYATENGKKVMKAGMPIAKDGKAVSATPFTNAVGILLWDVPESRPKGTILTSAYINVKRAKASCSVKYDKTLVDAMVNAGNKIRFEETDAGNDVLVGDLSGAGES